MENSYFVKTVLGNFALVGYKDFKEFLDILNIMHPDYSCIITDLNILQHTYKIKHFYVNDNEVAKIINDPEYIPFS